MYLNCSASFIVFNKLTACQLYPTPDYNNKHKCVHLLISNANGVNVLNDNIDVFVRWHKFESTLLEI
jgi:hypothetical protein